MKIWKKQGKKVSKDQESRLSNTTPDQGYHIGKWQKQLNITNERNEVSHFPADYHRAAMTDAKAWQTQNINDTNESQKKYRLGTVSKKYLAAFIRLYPIEF